MKTFSKPLFCCFFCLISMPILGYEVALVVVDGDGNIVMENDDCATQESPCSTFKIPLCLIGFDKGLLQDSQEPYLEYNDTYQASLEQWRHAQTPSSWIRNSCVWYSQQLTAAMGLETLQDYCARFGYGNQDLSGDPGECNGLKKAWLCSSLKISPREQVYFLRKLIKNNLPVSCYAHEMTKQLLFVRELSDGGLLFGKGGGGVLDHKSIGWFVGWVVQPESNKFLIFACLLKSFDCQIRVGSSLAQQIIVEQLHQTSIF